MRRTMLSSEDSHVKAVPLSVKDCYHVRCPDMRRAGLVK